MLVKLLKVNANDAIISGATAISNSGSVTFLKSCQAPAPSTFAASVSAPGIDCSAPSETRKKYGKVSQTLTTMTDTFAHVGSNSQGMCAWRMPRLITPKSSLSKPCQTSNDRNEGTAYGSTSNDRYRRCRPMPFLSSVIARKSPSENDRSTVEVAKTNVQMKTRRNGLRTSGLWIIRPKFLSPTP